MEEEAEKQRFGEEEDAKLEEVNKTGMSIGELNWARDPVQLQVEVEVEVEV